MATDRLKTMNMERETNLRATPFFIVGCGRSGTTLLKSILNAHPNVFVAPETFYFRSIKKRIKESTEPWNSVNFWWLRDAGITPALLRPFVQSRMEHGQNLDAVVFGAIMDLHASRNKNCLIGEKTPSHVKYVDQIRSIYPDAKFIQIYRDPRAVYSSFKKVDVGPRFISEIMKEWLAAAKVMRRRSDDKNYLTLKYEGLIERPEVNLKNICEFLELKWHDSILNFHSRKEPGFAQEQKHHQNTQKPLFRTSINSWQNELKLREVGLIEWSVGSELEALGYDRAVQHKLAFPGLWMKSSEILGIIHRITVRYPRQRIKEAIASRRIARQNVL
jgi:hypothetical protein